MAIDKTINLNVDTGDSKKDVDGLNKSLGQTGGAADDAKKKTEGFADSFGVLGVTVGGLKASFRGAMKSAKSMFGSIKAGLISTGIGAFVIALGAMAQYFKDNEEGASKLREITSQIGVVFGNVTDIISDFGGALVKLFSKDLKGFKEGIKDAIDGVKNFGEATREEMEMAKNLEKERAELLIFQREANVSKAKSEAEIMKLRMQARDEEKFTNEERLSFMRQANKLADEQLKKDLHIAEMKLKHQQIENSYSKSSTENLEAEANLEAELFRIQRSNFSERKRMVSEEQAIVKRISSEKKKEEKEEETRIQKEKEAKEKELELLRTSGMSAMEIELEQAQTKYDKLLALAEKYGVDSSKITEQFEAKKVSINKKYNDKEEKDEEKLQEAKQKALTGAMTSIANLIGKETKAGKAIATASAIIDTYVAANKALAQGGILGIASAAGIVATGLANVKTIQGTEIPGESGGGGGGTATSTSVSLPEQIGGLGGTIPNIESIIPGGANGIQPVQAFVVESDISDSQALQEELDIQATL